METVPEQRWGQINLLKGVRPEDNLELLEKRKRRKRLFLLLLSLPVIFLLTGLLLPETKVTVLEWQIAADKELVWQTITNVGGYANWRHDVAGCEVIRESWPVLWREVGKDGSSITFQMVERYQNRKFVYRVQQPEFPVQAEWTLLLYGSKDGTLVTMSEKSRIRNLLLRVPYRLLFRSTATMRQYLENLDIYLAPGENDQSASSQEQ